MPPALRGDRVNGAAIRTIRERSGLSMSRFVALLQDHTNVSRGHMAHVECGSRGASPELITAICAVLKCERAAILADPTPCPKRAA
jgi:transcriptional regulator with XRE-family HTH domain